MPDIGDLNKIGFRIGPVTPERQMRNVAIYINGENLSPVDPCVHLPNFLMHLRDANAVLKKKIDYLKYEHLFSGLNVTEIHNALLHNNASVFESETEWSVVQEHCRFADWGETTNVFSAFLIPYFDKLYLTYQSRDRGISCYDVAPVIDGVLVTPYYLIVTIQEAFDLLNAEA